MANTTVGAIILQGDGKSFIGENSVRKEALISPMPLYLSDSDETDIFDFGGVIKTFNIFGVYVAANIGDAKTWIDALETLIQGHQDVAAGYPLEFTDDYRGTKKVKIMDDETTTTAGEPLIIRWTLKLIESSENA